MSESTYLKILFMVNIIRYGQKSTVNILKKNKYTLGYMTILYSGKILKELEFAKLYKPTHYIVPTSAISFTMIPIEIPIMDCIKANQIININYHRNVTKERKNL